MNILSLELYFLDLVAIGLQSCERLQNKFGSSTLRTNNLHISSSGLLPLTLNLTLSCCVWKFKPRIISTRKSSKTDNFILSYILYWNLRLVITYPDTAVDAIDAILSQLITFKDTWLITCWWIKLSVLPLAINTWNLWLLVYKTTTDLLSRLLLGPSSHTRVGNVAVNVCWLEVLEPQNFEKYTLHRHLKHSLAFAGHFDRRCDGLSQCQHLRAVVLDSCLFAIELTNVS